jgi:hypothetical protein
MNRRTAAAAAISTPNATIRLVRDMAIICSSLVAQQNESDGEAAVSCIATEPAPPPQ